MTRQTTNGSAPAPIRVALVGLGYWGPNLLRNFSESPMFELAWACDMRQEALDPIARFDALRARKARTRGRQACLRRKAARRGQRGHRRADAGGRWQENDPH